MINSKVLGMDNHTNVGGGEFSSKISTEPFHLKLRLNNVSRLKLGLSRNGQLLPAEEKFLQIEELSKDDSENSLRNPPALITVNKCKRSDPYAMMPSNSQSYNAQYSEPVRRRERDWFMESQRYILGDEIDLSLSRRKKNRLNETAVKTRSETAKNDCLTDDILGSYPPLGRDTRKLKWIREIKSLVPSQIIWRGCMTISRTRAIMTVYGLGIAGRAYADGLSNPRYLMIQAYDQEICVTSKLLVSMSKLKSLFRYFPALLQPGQKREMVIELCKLCYFEYEGNNASGNEIKSDGRKENIYNNINGCEITQTKLNHNHTSHGNSDENQTKSHSISDQKDGNIRSNTSCEKNGFNDHIKSKASLRYRLCISEGKKIANITVTKRRKLIKKKREESIQIEEAAQKAYQTLAKRKRDLIHGKCFRLYGIYYICMVYIFKNHPGILFFRFYDRRNCSICEVTIDIETLSRTCGTTISCREEIHEIVKSVLSYENSFFESDEIKSQLVFNKVENSFTSVFMPLQTIKLCFEQPEIMHYGNHFLVLQSLSSQSRHVENTERSRNNNIYADICNFLYWKRNEKLRFSTNKEVACWNIFDKHRGAIPVTIRRDIGKGIKLSSGSVKIENAFFNYSLYRRSNNIGKSFDVQDKNMFDLELYSARKFGNNHSYGVFRFQFDMNDLYRICRDTNALKPAFESIEEKQRKKKNAILRKVDKIYKKEREKLDGFIKELISFDSQNIPMEVQQQKSNDMIDTMIEFYDDRKIEGKKILSYNREEKEAWSNICHKIFTFCSLHNYTPIGKDNTIVNGVTGLGHLVVSGMLAEALTTKNSVKSTIYFDCTVYRADHMIDPNPKYLSYDPRLFHITASQEGERLNFIARDALTGHYCLFHIDEQKLFVESMQLLSKKEVTVLIAESLTFLEYHLETNEKSKDCVSLLKLTFGEPKAIDFQAVSEEEFQQAENYMDDMIELNLIKAENRQKAAMKKIY